MADLPYRPVRHNHAEAIARARRRPGFSEAYDALEQPYALARQLLAARSRAGLTQEAVAQRMGTSKSAVSRLEGVGQHAPSLTTLKRYAEAVGCELRVTLEPLKD